MLTREEIGREPVKLIFEETKLDGITVVPPQHVHVRDRLSEGPLQHGPDSDGGPAVSRTLKICPWICGYENYSYSDLSSEIFLNSGGISFSVTSYPDLTKAGSFTGVLVCSARSALREA